MTAAGASPIGHQPAPVDTPSVHTIASAEALLSDWFGADVILTSSGRAAILLVLEELRLNRYADLIAVPRMISSCVLDAVIRRAFPIDAATDPRPPALTIFYHQYGIPQARVPTGLLLDDICHALYAGPDTGRRPRPAPAAVFSLPKFLPMAAMAGGLIVTDADLAVRLRARRDAHDGPPADSAHHATVYRASHTGHAAAGALEQVYLARLLDPRPADTDLAGLPETIDGLRDIGRRRQTILDMLTAALPKSALPTGWLGLLRDALPFALPVFGDSDRLAAIDRELVTIGVRAGIYRIDIARDMRAPVLAPALLVPCHHAIPAARVADIARILAGVAPL